MAAKTRAVWGIDIGQYALKALKIQNLDGAGKCAAVAFDYIAFPKILSQPDAIPEELIPEALETFLSRNDVKDDLISISVPGHAALTRFIQLPPVESGKLAEIVKYEARQQIPFALEDVIWDFQPLGSGIEESGYLLDAEVGLFAMKKEQVYQQLRPFQNAKLEVELIQIAPLALFNMLCYDELGMRPGDSPPNPDEYSIVLDMGCDNTTLMVSNGEKIWIRNVPIGGNHFTRALTKEMKLSFAKAEHLKCNATKSDDPRRVFQALRPVFNDYVSEIQRSIGFFSSVNRQAKISKVIGLGNGFKLAGLQKFLQQNLQYEVERPETFHALAGDSVLNSPLFADNILSFAVPYGLAIQSLGLTAIKTSLLPPEIAVERTIRRKKPWAVTAAASLLVGLAIATAGNGNSYRVPHSEEFQKAEEAAVEHNGYIGSKKSAFDSENGRLTSARGQLTDIVTDRRDDRWLQIYKAINACLPRDTATGPDENKPIPERNQISIVQLQTERSADLEAWYNKNIKKNTFRESLSDYDKENPPSGEGYIITVHGLHYHVDKQNPNMKGVQYVKNTLLKDLQSWQVSGKPGMSQPQDVGRLGISHAGIVYIRPDLWVPAPVKGGGQAGSRIAAAPAGRNTSDENLGAEGAGDIVDPDYAAEGFATPGAPGSGRPGGRRPRPGRLASPENQDYLKQTVFVIQFVVQYKPESEREDRAPWESGEEPTPEE